MGLDYTEDKNIAGSAASSIIGNVKDGFVSTGADLVSTIWNSTVGLVGGPDISTQDILTKVDKDALSFYNEHREGVEAASFLAGIIAPQAVTLKLLGMAKNGATALGKSNSMASHVGDVFSGSKAQALQTELKVMFESAKYDTTAYNTTMRKLQAAKIGENAIDAAIFEAATVGILNAHPYMEDYMESPFQNFALWATVGAGVGGALGYIQAKASVRGELGDIAVRAQSDIASAIVPVNQAMPNGAQVQTLNISIRNVESIITSDKNPLTKAMAQDILINMKAAKEERILEAAPWLAPIGKDKPSDYIALKPEIEKMLSMPEMMGVDKIKLPNMKFVPKAKGERLQLEIEMLEKPTKEINEAIKKHEQHIAYWQKEVRILDKNGATDATIEAAENMVRRTTEQLEQLKRDGTKLKTVFYRPSTGDLYDRNLAGAAALAVDLKGYKPSAKNLNLYIPRADWHLENAGRGKPSAMTDAEYLDALTAWNNVKAKDVGNFGIAPGDLASQNGAVAWLAKQTREMQETIQFNLRSDLPSFQQTTKFIESGAAGVKPTHLKDIENIIDTKRVAFIDVGISDKASDAIGNWIHGHGVNSSLGIETGKAQLRRAFDAFFRGTQLPAGEKGNTLLAKEIWDKGAKFREELRQVADAEGNIRLYRGIYGDVKGASSVESYSTRAGVSDSFGTARLFKIPVENVIGAFGKGNRSEFEILVTNPHHRILDGLDVETAANTAVTIPGAASKNTISGVELMQHYTKETERQIKQMIGDTTFTPEEIAARLNTTKEAVLLVGMGKNLDEIPNWRRYDDASKIESEYLNQKNRIIALQGDPVSNQFTPIKLAASLDERFLSAAHQQFVEQVTAKHHSSFADDLLNGLWHPMEDADTAKTMRFMLDQLKQNIGEVNNILIKNPLFQSVDMALRNIKDGNLVTFIGKRVSDIQDAAIKRVLEPVGASFKGLANQVALVEFNTLKNKAQSLTGWKMLRIEEETGFGYLVQREVRDGQITEVPVKNLDGSVYYVKTPEAINAWEGMRAASQEMFKLHNLNRELRGQGPLNDLGDYVPPPAFVNRYFSYVVDNTGKQRTSVLVANTPQELKQLESAYQAEVISHNPTIQIIKQDNKEAYNLVHGYVDDDPFMTFANVQLKHGGSSASAIVPADARFIDEIMEGYQQQILAGMRKYNEMYLSDITQKLDAFSKINQAGYTGQPVKGFFKSKAPEDAARTVKNALLANNNLDQFTTWKSVNEFVDMSIVMTGRGLDTVSATFRKNQGSREHFDALDRELTSKGINNPWESFELYQASLLGAPAINSKRVVSAANGLMGTMMLRFLELGHPLVNAISVPILASGAVMEGLPSTELPNGAKIKLPMRLLMDAMRFSFNPKGQALHKEWEAAGHINQVVRQYAEVTGKLHIPAATKGEANTLLGMVENLQNSPIMDMLSKPSDMVEKQSRVFAMNLGYLAAKHAYPGISDRAATIYAVGMSDRVIGNYHAAQRPAMFQGSFGAVLGLFQTYMLSFAQHTYRTIEHGQFKALATTMAAQAGIFGTASWPGYEQLSKFIGEHMSNQNYDLTTGTYRAVGDPMAQVILYGLPSTLGPSLYTRGDIAPRIPSQLGDLAIVNSTVGVYNSVAKMLSSVVSQPGFDGKLQGMMEGLSLQTLSRPIARASEIVAGESITRKGQTVATSDDVWTMNGIASRLLSVRPLEEQVTRNALNLNSYYGAADYDNRQAAVNKLRTAIRAGHIDDDLIDTVAESYIRHGGTNKGWNAVMNEIMSRTEEGTSYDLLRKLEPDSPLRRMLNDTF